MPLVRIRRSRNDRLGRAILAMMVLGIFAVGVVYLYDAALKEEEKKKTQYLEELYKNPDLNRFADELYYSNTRGGNGEVGDFNVYLNKMSPSVRDSVKEIRINDNPGHYDHKGMPGENVIAHYCPFVDDGTICVRSDCIFWKPGSIYHEATHAHWHRLRRNRDPFTHNWQFVPGAPISKYGSTSPEENIAELVANFHLELDGQLSEFANMDRCTFDANHRKHFEALRANGFITDSDYFRFLNKKGF